MNLKKLNHFAKYIRYPITCVFIYSANVPLHKNGAKSKDSHSSKPVCELTDIIVTLSVCFHRLKEGIELVGGEDLGRVGREETD